MIQIPDWNIAECVHEFLRLGRKDSTRPPLGGFPKNNLFRPRQKEKRPRCSSTLGYVGPRDGWRGGAREEGWCARMERQGKERNPTSQHYHSLQSKRKYYQCLMNFPRILINVLRYPSWCFIGLSWKSRLCFLYHILVSNTLMKLGIVWYGQRIIRKNASISLKYIIITVLVIPHLCLFVCWFNFLH
jgi:hypothetical protein